MWLSCRVTNAPATITSLENLRKELLHVRDTGYSIDNIENELGVRCVAAPILNHRASPIAAVSVSGPLNVFMEQR